MGRGMDDYLSIGTLESYEKMKRYFGEIVLPVYIMVETGIRLERALMRERQQRKPNYVEMCRRFLADEEDFSEENLMRLGVCEMFENENLDRCVENIKSLILRERF
jgi:guanylate kinase